MKPKQLAEYYGWMYMNRSWYEQDTDFLRYIFFTKLHKAIKRKK